MLESIKRLLRLTDNHSKNFIWSVVFSIISVLLSFVPFYCIYKVIMYIDSGNYNSKRLLIIGIISIISIVLRYITFGISTVISHKTAFEILYDLRVRIAQKLTKLSLGYFGDTNSGQIKNIIIDDVESLEKFLAHNVPEVTSNLSSLIIVTLYLFFLDYRMALATLAVIPIAIFAMSMMMRGQEEKMCKFHSAMANMNTNIVEYISGMHVIKIFNNSVESFKKYSNSVNDYNTHVLNWYKSCWPYMSIYFVILASNILFVLPIGGYFYINNSLSLGKFILFLIISFIYSTPLIKLFDFTEGMQIIAENERKITELLDEKEIQSTNSMKVIKDYTIKFNDVVFGYKEKNILDEVNIVANHQEVTALVGPSGGGKSTISKLIPRFWDVNQGQISVGDINIHDIKTEQLMEMMSFVFQDVFLFDLTIKDNIKLGNPNATDDEVIHACKLAQCNTFINKLKDGYNTMIGQKGVDLSGGEKQRISIARAILKNSPIIILDEATAFTDAENEDLIQTALMNLVKDKTVIMIAHRLSTIVNANKIYVVKDGKINSSGTHTELIKNSKIYNNMWKAHVDANEWEFDVKGGKNYDKDDIKTV